MVGHFENAHVLLRFLSCEVEFLAGASRALPHMWSGHQAMSAVQTKPGEERNDGPEIKIGITRPLCKRGVLTKYSRTPQAEYTWDRIKLFRFRSYSAPGIVARCTVRIFAVLPEQRTRRDVRERGANVTNIPGWNFQLARFWEFWRQIRHSNWLRSGHACVVYF